MADLSFTADEANEGERAAVDAVIASAGPAVIFETERLIRAGLTRRNERRDLLLPALHALQRESGWISPGGLNYACDLLQVPPAEGYGVASFYELFRLEEPDGQNDVVHVCVDAACQMAGANELADRLTADGSDVHRGPCLGQCERAPALFVQGLRRPDSVPADVDATLPFHQVGQPGLRLMHRVGIVDPDSIDSFMEHGGYSALAKSVEMGPDAVIEAVRESGLSGRGGAAFPTGIKWRGVADEKERPRHVVANCDESEPGTFKDRVLMEHDPFALIEALTLAGLAVGAEQGWIYIRGEYPRATARLLNAIDAAESRGFLGDDVAGSGSKFRIELRRGAGAYICGEETALFNSIEGFRGEPRNKPPFPTTHGLFGEPTAINNPETLVNVLDVVLRGASSYRRTGTDRSPGTKLFCLSGHVVNTGVYEVPFGTTLAELLDLAGGPTGEIRTILMGGAAGSFVSGDQMDLPLTLEDTREAGATLGSGVVMVFNTDVNMTDIVMRIAEFFRGESCGQCVPCRVGVVRQHETLVELQSKGSSSSQQLELIDDMAKVMADASICGLGHTASSAIQSALRQGLI